MKGTVASPLSSRTVASTCRGWMDISAEMIPMSLSFIPLTPLLVEWPVVYDTGGTHEKAAPRELPGRRSLIYGKGFLLRRDLDGDDGADALAGHAEDAGLFLHGSGLLGRGRVAGGLVP